jgi:xanthine/CO dehydrogenase XdhC/CoxF family maturation factor
MTEWEAILKALEKDPAESAALATVVHVEGSSYRRPGARLLVLSGGECVGSISGGCLESDMRMRAKTVIQKQGTELVVYDTTDENDLIWGLGLGCRGIITILMEWIPTIRPRWLSLLAENLDARQSTELAIVWHRKSAGPAGTFLPDEAPRSSNGTEIYRDVVQPPPSVTVFGAGDDVRPLVRLAKEAGWHVTVIDSRAAYAAHSRFPEADKVILSTSEHMDECLNLNSESFVVLMTHRYTQDLGILPILMERQPAYLGVLGSRRRTEQLLGDLKRQGFVVPLSGLENLCAPVGLDLGGTTPETVALSIVAEMQCRLTGRTPIHLKDRNLPIHA